MGRNTNQSTEESSIRVDNEQSRYDLTSSAAGSLGSLVFSSSLIGAGSIVPVAALIGTLGGFISTIISGAAADVDDNHANRYLGVGFGSAVATSFLVMAGSYLGSYNTTITNANSVQLENGSSFVLTQRNGDKQYLSCKDGKCIDLETEKTNALDSVVGETKERRQEIENLYDAMISEADSKIAKSNP